MGQGIKEQEKMILSNYYTDLDSEMCIFECKILIRRGSNVTLRECQIGMLLEIRDKDYVRTCYVRKDGKII